MMSRKIERRVFGKNGSAASYQQWLKKRCELGTKKAADKLRRQGVTPHQAQRRVDTQVVESESEA
jgi:TPR repeat protein